MIVWFLWRRGLLARLDREKLAQFIGIGRDRLLLSRRYPMWRSLGVARMVLVPAFARDVARWLEYRMNLYDGIEG